MTLGNDSTKPRWARRKEARPQELLCAALQIFSKKGYSATRLEDVARHAGVSKATVYLYYANKEELLKAVVKEHVAPVVSLVTSRQSDHQKAALLIQESLELWWERYGSTQLSAITKLILSEAHNFPELAKFFHEVVVKPWWTYLESLLTHGVNSGEFQCTDVEYTAKVLCAPLVTLGLWKHSMDPSCQINTDPQRYLGSYIEMVLNGLKHPNTP